MGSDEGVGLIVETISTGLAGVAGEYLVAGELSRRGYIATLTLKNTRGIDILCSNMSATKLIGIQVKTNRKKQKYWIMTNKSENLLAENLFYIFVSLNDGNQPDFYIVPSKQVATFIKTSHQNWLATPGKKGQKHNDGNMRMFSDKEGKYLNRWDLLELD